METVRVGATLAVAQIPTFPPYLTGDREGRPYAYISESERQIPIYLCVMSLKKFLLKEEIQCRNTPLN